MHFETVNANFKTENLQEKIASVYVRKDFILDLDNKIF